MPFLFLSRPEQCAARSTLYRKWGGAAARPNPRLSQGTLLPGHRGTPAQGSPRHPRFGRKGKTAGHPPSTSLSLGPSHRAAPCPAARLGPRRGARGSAGPRHLPPAAASQARPAPPRASPGGGPSSRPGRGGAGLGEGEAGKKSSGRGRGAGGGAGSRRPPPAPRPPGLRGLFGQKRKRGFSKVKEETKRAGQPRKEQTQPDVSGRGAANAPSAFYPNSSRQGLTVCVPGGQRKASSQPGRPRGAAERCGGD